MSTPSARSGPGTPSLPSPRAAHPLRSHRRSQLSALGLLERAEVCAPSPRSQIRSRGRADLVSIFGRTAAGAQTPRPAGTQCWGQEVGRVRGGRASSWGRRSSLKGTGMPGTGEGQEPVPLWQHRECLLGRTAAAQQATVAGECLPFWPWPWRSWTPSPRECSREQAPLHWG